MSGRGVSHSVASSMREEFAARFKAIATVTGRAIRDAIEARVPPLVEQAIAPLVERLDALEAAARSSKAFRYRGVYATGFSYDAGDTVTFGGSLWHCDAATSDRPGENAGAWTLAVKRGRDGKDVGR